MNIPEMRAQLIAYISEAGEKKITGLYAILEEQIEAKATAGLSADELNILNLEREKYLMGDGISYTYGSLENGMYLINIKSDKVLYSGKLARISN